MLAPVTDAYAPVITFAVPTRERQMALLNGMLLVLAGMLVWVSWQVPPGVRMAASMLAGLGAAALFWRAARIERIELDLSTTAYRRRRGVGFLASQITADLTRPLRLCYAVVERSNAADGRPEHFYTAWLSAGNADLPLAMSWPDRQAPEFFALMAERLDAPLVSSDVLPSRRLRLVNTGAAVMWAGVLAVFALMFWPILSGKRPLKLAWASAPGPAASVPREEALFSDGLRAYDIRDYDRAEKLFTQAMASGKAPAECYNMIAYAQAARNRMDDALRSAEGALNFEPNSGNILDTVGEMHELRKEYAQAVDYYQQALRQGNMTSTVETDAKLGRSLLALHRKKEALTHLRKAALYPKMRGGPIAVKLLVAMGEPLPTLRPPKQQQMPIITERN